MTKLRIVILATAIIAIAAVTPGPAKARQGPGFDCTKAHHPLAQLICADDDLSRIDLLMNEAYDAYRNIQAPEGKKSLAQQQAAFIRNVIEVCRISAIADTTQSAPDALDGRRCVAKAYVDRTDALKILAGEVGRGTNNAAATRQEASSAPPPKIENPGTSKLATIEVPTVATKNDEIVVQGSINGRPVTFLVDSGASSVNIPDLIAGKLNLGSAIDVVSVSFADGRTTKQLLYKIDLLRIGDAEIHNVRATVGGDGDSILLGRTALNQFDRWTVDTRNGKLLLFKNQSSAFGDKATPSSEQPETKQSPRQQSSAASPAPAIPPAFAALPRAAVSVGAVFDKFPAGHGYQGTPVMPDFQGRDRNFNGFRTRIRNGIQEGANFAGRYKVIQFGCGTGCSFVIVADVSTGRVYNFPHGGEYDQMLGWSIGFRAS
jgi:clan AA aspartic protease (TIGR02281 family)